MHENNLWQNAAAKVRRSRNARPMPQSTNKRLIRTTTASASAHPPSFDHAADELLEDSVLPVDPKQLGVCALEGVLIGRKALRLVCEQQRLAELVERRDACRRRDEQLFQEHESRG